MISWLNGYGPSNLEALLALVAISVLVAAGCWLLRRRGQRAAYELEAALAETRRLRAQLRDQLAESQRERELDAARHDAALAEVRARCDPAHIVALQDHLQRVIAHEFVKGLHFIGSQSEETLAGLRADQPDLRDRLNEVRAKAYEMVQHARNVVGLPDLARHAPQRELVNLRGLLEGVLKELFPYAEARGVHLQIDCAQMGTVLTVRSLVHQLCSNVVHNAIKYSFTGGVVQIALRVQEGDERRALIEVRDHGIGVAAKDRERIFQLNVRGDGLMAPGSGLGLYTARESLPACSAAMWC